jgi:hypothetical protein
MIAFLFLSHNKKNSLARGLRSVSPAWGSGIGSGLFSLAQNFEHARATLFASAGHCPALRAALAFHWDFFGIFHWPFSAAFYAICFNNISHILDYYSILPRELGITWQDRRKSVNLTEVFKFCYALRNNNHQR